MTGIGPVEPYREAADSQPLPPHPSDVVVGTDSPRAYERWAALSSRRRRLLLAGLGGAVAVAGALWFPRPEPPAPPAPPPWPAQVTHLRYEGAHGATFRFVAHVDRGPTVTISHIRAGDPRLAAAVAPTTPVTVTRGTPRPLTVRISVRDCAALPRALDMAYLDVTLHNRRGKEQHGFIFVDRYPHDLFTLLHARCTAPRSELTQR
ncbi:MULTISPECIES: hypothetical protein [unclassified Streptomyces]|uniref:hypothetical protein n=1 Tax=unclassified Streptomyces TaxID=2593676 RepID=UPI00278C2272|nr:MULTISPECIES: hypothetical protein [unclassified Streptomyces]